MGDRLKQNTPPKLCLWVCGGGGGIKNTQRLAAQLITIHLFYMYSETCLKRPLKNRQNKGLKAMW